MKLSAFSEYVNQNPFNALNKEEGEAFIKNREKQLENWRNLVYGSIKNTYPDFEDELDMDKGIEKKRVKDTDERLEKQEKGRNILK
jgi:hypothetical protein